MNLVNIIKKIPQILYLEVIVFFREAINSLVYLKYNNPIIIKAWVIIKNGTVVPNNWGDDLNVPFLHLITKCQIIVCNHSLFHKITRPRHYLCIGSLLGDYETEKSEIWGSGFISESDAVKAVPYKIHSVRGKLSRKKFLESGIDCPESYGDPALLLSKFYKPTIKKKYRLGIIPNHMDNDNIIISNIVLSNSSFVLINLHTYKVWTEVIDMILSCEYIISSSLHGLIIADSYNIPNDWVFFSDKVIGGYFKFLDYFSSVDRNEKEPIWITDDTQIYRLLDNHHVESQAKIDFNSIINSCPFKLMTNN